MGQQRQTTNATANCVPCGSKQRLQIWQRRRINQCGGGILIVKELEESRIKHAVAPNNENQFGVVRPDFGDLLRGNWTAGVAAKVDCDLCAMR